MSGIGLYLNFVVKYITIQNLLLWGCVALISGALCFWAVKAGKMKRKNAVLLVLLILYLTFVVTITLLNRTPTGKPRYMLKLFWAYRYIRAGRTTLLAEKLWNVLFFIPVGLVLANLLPRGKYGGSVVLAAVMSAGIELAQLLSHRGLFEYDDMICNTLGAGMGVLLYFLWGKGKKRLADSRQKT